jgi:uncharacterized RDD family membrane protein YckC
METALVSDGAGETAYARVLARLGAYLVDCLLLFIGLLAWQAILYAVNPLVPIIRSGRQPTGAQLHLWVFATATIPFLFYFALMLRSARQATFGMRLLKLEVADVGGGRVGFGQAILRSALMLIPFELNHAVMFHLSPRDAPPSTVFWLGYVGVWAVVAVYVAAILLTRRGQSVHDLVAGTVVRRIG